MTTYPEPENFPQGASLTDGIWTQILCPKAYAQGQPALFLDRDGVVVEDAHYLHKPENVSLTLNGAKTIKAANKNHIPVVLVTNQAGIGYGYFKWDDFIKVQNRILSDLADLGARVDGVFACPFHAKGQGVYAFDNHPARKPNPGMLNLAQSRMGMDLSTSWIVGDRALDLMAGKNAGLQGGVHVLTGHGSKDGEAEHALSTSDATFTAFPAANLGAARDLIPLLK